jgi:hypothetical protein
MENRIVALSSLCIYGSGLEINGRLQELLVITIKKFTEQAPNKKQVYEHREYTEPDAERDFGVLYSFHYSQR